MAYESSIGSAAKKHGLDPSLLYGVVKTESNFNPDAVSKAGAIGLGQLMPGTAAQYGVDPYDPEQNLDGAAQHLAYLSKKYEGDTSKILAAYNFGEGNIDKGKPLPAETKAYIPKVQSNAKSYHGEEPDLSNASEEQKLAYQKDKAEWDMLMQHRAEYDAMMADRAGGGSFTKGSAKRALSPGATIGSIAGGIKGGAVGFSLGGPVGGVVGGIAGAIGGAGIGEAGQQAYDTYKNNAYAPHSQDDSLKRVGTEMGYAAIGEAGGALANAAIKSVGAGLHINPPFTFSRPVAYGQIRQLTPEQASTQAFFDRHGIRYSADQITGAPSHNFIRAVGDNGVFSTETRQQFLQQQEGDLRVSANGLADTMGRNMPQDELIVETLKYIDGQAKHIDTAVINPAYNTIATDLNFTQHTVQVPTGKQLPHPQGLMGPNGQPLMVPEMVDQTVSQGGLLVDLRPIKQKFAAEITELEKRAIDKGDVKFDALRDNNPSYNTMKDIVKLNDNIQWTAAHDELKITREKLHRAENAMDVAGSKLYDRGKLIDVERSLDDQMGLALKQSADPKHAQDYAIWEKAQKAVRHKYQTFKNDTIMALSDAVKASGGDAGWQKFANKMTADQMEEFITAASQTKRPDLVGDLRAAFMRDRLTKAAGIADPDAPFDVHKFEKFLFGKDEAAGRKANLLYDPTHQAKLRELITATEHAQDAKGGGMGAVFISLKSSSAMFSLPKAALGTLGLGVAGVGVHSISQGEQLEAAGEGAAAIGIIFGPNLFAKMLNSKKMTEYMIQGLRYSAANSGSMKGGTPIFNSATGQWESVGGTFSPSTTAQIVRVTREMMRLDQGFAQAIRAGVSAYNAEQTSGPIHRTAETVQKAVVETLPSTFGLQQ